MSWGELLINKSNKPMIILAFYTQKAKKRKLLFLKPLRRSLENKNGTPFIIFLNDEYSNSPAGEYVWFLK